ncbi:MAG: multidrug effflux MFS transporter [Flavobacteriales bacterium]|nr:multidrug effflux MFS transporter [Flavobacteriales bacterium]
MITQEKSVMKFGEFVALMAMMMSLTALSIDAMLPALTEIGNDLGVIEPNDNQLIISTLFLGLAFGQLFYGPLSDGIGRKPSVYIGLVLFALGCLVSIFAENLSVMLIGRALQGFGLSGTRTISVAIIRDKFKGDKMAQVMSFVMAAFIVVPTIAPFMGQGILLIAHWKFIFWTILGLGFMLFVWFSTRQQETLPKENRVKFSGIKMLMAAKEVVTTRVSLGYTLAAGFISSAFVGFLNSSQQIFQIQFDLGEKFPIFFASMALSVGAASFVNGKLVLRFGMKFMVKWASIGVSLLSVLFAVLMLTVLESPSLTLFMIYLCTNVFCVGILFGNLNSMAMEPLGHIAGMGAAIVGALSTFISVPFGAYIGQCYDGTVFPLVLSFVVFGVLTAISIWISGNKPLDKSK